MLNEIRIAIADFLGIVLFENNFLFFDLWSIVHFISGFIIMFVLFKFGLYKVSKKLPFFILPFLLILYEAIEYFTILFGGTLFRYESPVGIFSDIVIGMFGGLLYYLIFLLGRKK